MRDKLENIFVYIFLFVFFLLATPLALIALLYQLVFDRKSFSENN